jgi:hypothetical protein
VCGFSWLLLVVEKSAADAIADHRGCVASQAYNKPYRLS